MYIAGDLQAKHHQTATTQPGTETSIDHAHHLGSAERATAVSFPYEFPKAGAYRLWVQVKVRDEVLTGIFDTNVIAARR